MSRRTTAALIATLALSLCTPERASAQTLRLDAVPQSPALGEVTAVTMMLETLNEELRALEAKQPESADDRTAIDARVELRRIARDFLIRGAEPGPPHDALAMQGFRLADVRRRVDVLANGLVDGTITVGEPPRPLGVRERDVAMRRLRRFVDIAPKALAAARLDDPVQAEAALAAAITPLCDAVATLEGKLSGDALGSGWPTQADLASAALRSTPISQPTDTDPCEPASRASAMPRTAAAIAERCAQPEIADNATIAIALDLDTSARAADWLTKGERETIDTNAAALVRGDVRVRSLRAAQSELLSTERRFAATKAGKDIDRLQLDATVRRALFPEAFTDVAFADDPERLARAIRRVTEAIDIATRFRLRESSDDGLSRDIKTLKRDFEKAYRRSEATTFARLQALLTDTDALTSPELVTLVTATRDALGDLDRVDGSRRLIDAVGGARPQAGKIVAGHVRTMLRWLLEPSRRAVGLSAYEALRMQVAMFSPLPFEDSLRRETPEATALAAGEPTQLAEAIDLARAEWADAWAAGDGSGAAAQRMLRLHRLLSAMEAFAPGIDSPESREAVATLSRWGAFHATRASMAPALVDLTATTKLAALAAIARDDVALDRELDRIERDAPLSRLTSRLLGELAPWLTGRPTGSTGVLAAIRTPAPDDAWGAPLKSTLAAIARFARELDHVRRSGDAAREKPLLGYLATLSRSALESLGAERSPVPALPQLVEPVTPVKRRDRK